MGGRDYPRDRPEFRRFFPDEDRCLAYLERLRWPDGFRCPACGGTEAWRTARGHLLCSSCRRQTSVTAGTIFAGDEDAPARLVRGDLAARLRRKQRDVGTRA